MQYAYFDPITRVVLGWIDTVAFDCVLPDASLLIEMSADEWDANADRPRWVTDGLSLTTAAPVRVASLDQIKVAKLAEISAACAAEIVGGFDSNALGERFTYPSQEADQSNLMAAVLSSLTASADDWETPVKCVDAQGVSAYRLHSAVQVQAVGNDSLAARNAAFAKKAALEARISQAIIVEQVTSANWPPK